ncbi:MAG: hypothetical protein BJBARM5_0704 [Candidatus Parvarchaeum acidophilus ARMAN-5]|uniref:SpoVR protein-like N-terminal domain-containing protein n=1 Tax=Candidatus Parvarchaeum acidophilus ARMAN-5 TaxID=662762 RepID=D6GW33_PARA5|nr:MAG: conserved hypothetical protein [Candidatus Parvarchaeum acidophilus ARMAN-5]
MPVPSWEAGQEKLLQEDRMKYRQGVLYEMVGHPFYNRLERKEFITVFINQHDTYDEILSVMAHVYGHLHIEYNNKLAKSVHSNYNKHEFYRDRYREMEKILSIEQLEQLYDHAQTLSGLMDLFPDFHKAKKSDYYSTERINPNSDVYDVYKFTLNNVKFNPWEKELLEMMYDINQLMKTARIKIMHEGFATFVEDKYATEVAKTDAGTAFKMREGILRVADVLSPSQLPYYLGFRLFKDIENRWNEGRHGPLYELLSEDEKRNYIKREDKGLFEILEIVKSYTDWDFIFSYADNDFFKKLAKEIEEKTNKLIERQYADSPANVVNMVKDYYNKKIDPNIFRFQLLMRTENYGPMLYVPKGSFNGDRLILRQDLSFLKRYTGIIPEEQRKNFEREAAQMFGLYNEDAGEKQETALALNRIASLWNIPVSLETMNKEGKPLTVTSNGKKIDVSEKGDGPKLDD